MINGCSFSSKRRHCRCRKLKEKTCLTRPDLRTKKAERAAKNRKRRAMDPVPVKEKKLKKDSRERTATLDLTELSGEVLNIIRGLGSKEDRVLANRFGIQLRQRDLDKLKPGQCLNHDVINYYLQLVVERNRGKAFALSSLLYTQHLPKHCSNQGANGNNVAIKKIDRSRRTSCTDEHLLQGHFQSVTAIAYRRNRQELITSANDRLALIWTPKMDKERPEYEQKAVDLHKDEYSDED
uniref:Uncharacterized protein n=1 Tax=Ditylenchus dipsaci TaxID=166011 RepID=A0A915EKX5_9BILA